MDLICMWTKYQNEFWTTGTNYAAHTAKENLKIINKLMLYGNYN